MNIYSRTTFIVAIPLHLAVCGPAPAPAGESSGDSGSTVATGSEVTGGSTAAPTTMGGTASVGTEVSTSSMETTNSTDFIVAPDGGGMECFAGVLPGGEKVRLTECDVFEQNCRQGEKCVPWGCKGSTWHGTICVKVTGDGVVGDPCIVEGDKVSGVDDCAFGHICWDVDDQLHGTCIAQCTGTPSDPQCAEGSICVIVNSDVVAVCLASCDPLVQDCLNGGLCLPGPEGFVCAPDDSGVGGQVNDPCEFTNSCDPGLVCRETATVSSACQQGPTGCCTPYCKFPGAPCPNPDQACVQWFDPMMPIPPGDEDIGVCAIPP